MILKARPVNRLTRLVALIRMFEGLDLVNGGWVAGGAARAVFEDAELNPKSDIDIYFPAFEHTDPAAWDLTRDSVRNAFLRIRSQNKTRSGTETLRGTVGKLHEAPEFAVQLIGSAVHPDVEHLFRSIDFTVCQFATDGHTLVYTEAAERDLAARVLNVETEYKKVVSRPARMAKYLNYGFDPTPGLLTWAFDLGNPKTKVSADMTVQYVY
jgi:hypothetical protein